MALPGFELLEEVRGDAVAFVETGTHRGDGIATALNVEFQDYFSVESSAFAYGWASHRFRGLRHKVHLHYGDSREFLRELLPAGPRGGIRGPCVIWLDAHWCGGDGEMPPEEPAAPPLLEELEIIAKHRCKTHRILIDDVRNFGGELPSGVEVLRALREINSEYEVRLVDGREFPKDILVATL